MPSRLVFARQEDGIVGAVEFDLVHRKIRAFDLLAINDMVVAVLTSEDGGLVNIDRERPKLELLRGDILLVPLAEGDFVEKPVGFRTVGEKLCAFGEDDFFDDAVAEKAFASGEVHQLAG